MTVISATLSNKGVAVGSDSFITSQQVGRPTQLLNSKDSKIIKVDKFSLILSYWGFSGTSINPLLTKNTLKECANSSGKYGDIYSFLKFVKTEIENLLIAHPKFGIGIHATTIEKWNGFSIPEMFLISNYADTTYTKLTSLELTRRTWFDFGGQTPQVIEKLEGENNIRLYFKNLFEQGAMFSYNNGDPVMFNTFARAYFYAMTEARNRSLLQQNIDLDTIAEMTTQPIEAVAHAQKTFYINSERIVGGKIHSTVIEPNGTIRIVK